MQTWKEPPWPPQRVDIQDSLRRVFDTGDWGRYHGRECDAFASELSTYFGGRQVTLCCSGTIAVELALRGLAVKTGDEVLLSGYDFPGNFRAIENLGAVPVLVDLAPNSWTLNGDVLAAAASPKTVAAVVSHLHGSLAPMAEIRQWADVAQVGIVEDACQVPGAKLSGQTVGTFGDVSVLSFGGSKLLTAGRGGAVISDDAQIMQRIRVFAERGNQAFPMSELQAAVLRPQLIRLDRDNIGRQDRVIQLIDALAGIAGLTPLNILPSWNPSAFYKLGWRFDAAEAANGNRDEIASELRRRGIPIDAGFRGFVRRSPRRCRRHGTLPHCQAAVDETLILHHTLLLESADRIEQLANRIRDVFDSQAHT